MKKQILLITCLLIVLSGCRQLPTDTEIPTLDATALNQTAVFRVTADYEMTQSALPTATLPPANTSTPIATIERTRSSASTPTPEIACNKAAAGNPFDITIPDGTKMMPNASFSKTWRLKNVGSCTWTRQYGVIFFSGNSLSAFQTHYLLQEVNPGGIIDITIDMQAPAIPGNYQSNWMLQDAEGDFFGIGPNGDAPFWVQIEVVNPATETPLPTIMVTATPRVYLEGTVVLGLGDQFDLDANIINPQDNTQADFLYQGGDLVPIRLTPINSTQWFKLDEGVPEYADCLNADLNDEILALDDQSFGDGICAQTSDGRLARLVIDQLSGDQITITYLVWSKP
jgi:hypothetical protein